MVDQFLFQLREGAALPAEQLSSPCLGQSQLIALMALLVLTDPKWVWGKLATAEFFKPVWPNPGEDDICRAKLCLYWLRGLLAQPPLAS